MTEKPFVLAGRQIYALAATTACNTCRTHLATFRNVAKVSGMNVRVGTLVCVASLVATGCFLAGNYEVGERLEGSPKSDEQDEDTTVDTQSDDQSTDVSLLGPDAGTTDTTDNATQNTSVPTVIDTSMPPNKPPPTTEGPPPPPSSDTTSTAAESTTDDPDAGLTPEPPPEPECPEGTTYDAEYELCVYPCDDGVRSSTGRCYWIGGEGSETAWDPVPDLCEARGEGWNVLSIRSQEEHEFVSSLLVADTWLGARDVVVNTWKWLDDDTTFWRGAANGRAVDGAFTAWGKNEPSAAADESCSRYHATSGGTGWSWSDCGCGSTGGFGAPRPPGSDKDNYRPACKGPEALPPLEVDEEE